MTHQFKSLQLKGCRLFSCLKKRSLKVLKFARFGTVSVSFGVILFEVAVYSVVGARYPGGYSAVPEGGTIG